MTMDKNKYDVIRLKMERTAEALRHNNIYCECVENCEEAIDVITSLINEGDTVAVGGSMTLFEAGVINLLRNGCYNFLDRYVDGLTRKEIEEIYEKAFSADVYFSSSNAITEKGELYNVDGNGNRVAAMIYGPKSVIIVAGYNKIVRDIEEAERRVKEIAAPANAVRLNTGTPCTQTGRCINCKNAGRICATSVTIGMQRPLYKDRIKVILVGEELGY